LKIGTRQNIVGYDDDTFITSINKVSDGVRTDALEGMVYIDNMIKKIFDEPFAEFIICWNNDLLLRGTFSSHAYLGFGLLSWAIDDLLDHIDLLVREIGECLLEFECIQHDAGCGGSRKLF